MVAKGKNPLAQTLDELKIAEIREIFTLFDKDADSYVKTSELGTIVRGLNLNPTQKEVEVMQKKIDPQNNGSFDINGLVSLMATQPMDNDTVEDCIESLRIIASDTGLGGDKDKGAPKTMILSIL